MWTMPHRTLQIVAALIVVCAIGGFVLGYSGTPAKPRLPGESATVGAPLEATEAKPLTGVVDTPKPEEPAPKAEEEEKTEEAAAEPALPPPPKLVEAPAQKAPAPVPPSPPEDKVGDLIDGITPQPEAPPF